jgi:hypothetical protein
LSKVWCRYPLMMRRALPSPMYRASIFDCDRHRVRPILWGGVVGGPGSRKSPTLGAVITVRLPFLRKLFGLWRGTSKPVFDRTNREKVLVDYVRQTQIKAGILVP